MDGRFEGMFRHLMGSEGGYQNLETDKGNWYYGKNLGTKYGITPRAYKKYTGIKPTTHIMRNLPFALAKEITYHDYYLKFQLDKVTDDYLAHLILDAVYNHGRGIKVVQRALQFLGAPLKADNIIGIKTLTAINIQPPLELYNEIKAQRAIYYTTLNQPEFLKGWLRRISSFNYGII